MRVRISPDVPMIRAGLANEGGHPLFSIGRRMGISPKTKRDQFGLFLRQVGGYAYAYLLINIDYPRHSCNTYELNYIHRHTVYSSIRSRSSIFQNILEINPNITKTDYIRTILSSYIIFSEH